MEEEPTRPALSQAPAVAVAGGTGDLAQLKLARFLSERAEAPTPEETQEFLNEVKARFGQEVQPNLEARVLLALLFFRRCSRGSCSLERCPGACSGRRRKYFTVGESCPRRRFLEPCCSNH